MDRGLKARKIYQRNFKKFGPSTIKQCTYTFIQNQNYVPGTGVITSPVLVNQPLGVIFDKFEAAMIDEDNIQSIDRIAIFPFLDILNNVELSIEDTILEIVKNKLWYVKGIKLDAMSVGYELHVRPSIPL